MLAQDQQLSPHFKLSEFTVSQEAARAGIRNEPLTSHIGNLKRVANVLEQVRALLGGHPIIISSGYRSPQVNKIVGGSRTSDHMQGLAADFICPGFGSPRDVCECIADSYIAFDQLIFEGSWVHLGLSAAYHAGRREVLTAIFEHGKDPRYLKGLV